MSEWHAWYSNGRWRRRSRHQLRLEPFCRICASRGVVSAASVADHITPHRGDWTAFWLGELQSLCKPCHDRDKRLIELRGHGRNIDQHGWPTDPRHPANQQT
jgi:5-methylcytosine-specific restriction endonuclease McrA